MTKQTNQKIPKKKKIDEMREYFLQKLVDAEEDMLLAWKQVEDLKKIHAYELKTVHNLLVDEFTKGYNTCKKNYGIKDKEE